MIDVDSGIDDRDADAGTVEFALAVRGAEIADLFRSGGAREVTHRSYVSIQ